MKSRLFQQTVLSKIHTLFSPYLFQYGERSALLTQARLFTTKNPLRDLVSSKHLKPNFLSTTDLFVKAVLYGDKVSVTKMLKANPNLLLKNGSAIDFSGRTFTGTGLQAALCTGDVEIGKIMKDYFSNTLEVMQQQFDAIFPKEKGGFEGHLAKQVCNTFDFTPIHLAIQAAPPNEVEAALAVQEDKSTLCLELDKFRQAFTQHSHREKVFNPQHVLRAFELYDTLWEDVPPTDRSNYPKRALVWRQILGFAERFLPACHAQDFAYGLYDIFVNKHSSSRSFNFRYDPNYSFFPLPNPRSGMGFDVAAISGSGRCAPYCLVRGGSRLCYKAYVEQKNQVWRAYSIDLNTPTNSR